MSNKPAGPATPLRGALLCGLGSGQTTLYVEGRCIDNPKVVDPNVKISSSLKSVFALIAGLALVVGSATVLDLAQPAQAAATPFTCTSDFYQVASGKMYQYSVASNTYSLMPNTGTVSGLNGIGYNTGDNYIYGVSSSTSLVQIASDGSAVTIPITSGTAQTTGGDFIAPNELLTQGTSGTWSEVNISTHTASAFTETGSTWKAYDFAYNPVTSTGYGISGTTLYIGVVSGTSVAVTTKLVTGFPTGTKATDQWGAAYVDSAGDAYFFDNTTFELVEISAAGLATASPSVVAITQANALVAPNDGASCPTASSPLAPTVTTTAATSVTTDSAVLNGTVATGIPDGSEIPADGIVICYSTSATLVGGALSVSPVCAPTTPSTLAKATGATAVALSVSGLLPGTTYYVQLEATNNFGLEAFGSVLSLTTDASASHTVSFDNHGGTGTMTDQVDNVSAALTANSFTKAGFTFTGWNTDINGVGDAYADGATYTFAADTTLYAQWAGIPTKTVTFDNNGGTGTMTDEVDNVPTALNTNTFTWAGHAFTGWNTASDGSGTAYAAGATYAFAADTTLFAQWSTIANKTVTFDNNGGTGVMASESHNVPTALTGGTFTKAGFSFAGWNTASDGSGTAYANTASYPFAVDKTLYAQWTALPNHTVTFDANNGTGTMANQVDNVPTALTTDAFTRAGYTFAGWNTASDGSGTAYANTASYPFAANAHLYAQWSTLPNKTVTFDNNGGAGVMADESHNVPTGLTSATFTKAGYTFAGWNTASDGSGTAYANTASYPFAANGTLYAQWATAPATVTFDPNSGTGVMADETANLPATLTVSTFTRVGYNFAGWNTAADGSGTAYADGVGYPFTANATMYAQWNHVPVLTFDVNGGSGAVGSLSSAVPTNLPTTTVARPGYAFTGWNTAVDGSGTAYAPGAMYPFASSGVLYAQYTKILAFTGVDPTPGLILATLLILLGLGLALTALITRKHGRHATSS
jgi:uncharacterized repeat protein (TIGR02543 family)